MVVAGLARERDVNIDWITHPWRTTFAYEALYAAFQSEIAARKVSVSSRWGDSVAASVLASKLATLTSDAFVEELVLKHRWDDVFPFTHRHDAETRAAFEAHWLAGEFVAAYAFIWDVPFVQGTVAAVWPR